MLYVVALFIEKKNYLFLSTIKKLIKLSTKNRSFYWENEYTPLDKGAKVCKGQVEEVDVGGRPHVLVLDDHQAGG